MLAWLNAHGTSSEPHEYEYLDRSTIPGQKVTYVLGETTYSQPVNMLDTFKVFIPTDTHFSLKAPFPNPANPESVIEIDVFKPCNLKMRIYDLNGHKIRDLIDNNMTVGKHKIALDLHNLPSGKYIVKCETKDQVKSFDVTLLK